MLPEEARKLHKLYDKQSARQGSRRMVVRAVTVLALLLLVLPASAKEPHTFDSQHFSSPGAQREYFNGLTNSNKNEAQPERPTGGLCCSFADGKRLEDPDWTAGIEVKGQKCVYAEDDELNYRTGSQYCVRIDGVWYQVPDSALVAQKNIIGIAEVWPVYQTRIRYGIGTAGLLRIRCFMPGAGG
jgi:hypothetical protein